MPLRSDLLVATLLVGCSSPVRLEPGNLYSSSKTFGHIPRLATSKPQEAGLGISQPVTRASFRELTLAQGGGMYGYDSIRIFSDGTGYVVVGNDTGGVDGATKIPIVLPEVSMEALIRAISGDRIGRLLGAYSAGIVDGSQGFVQLTTTDGSVRSWLDNYFLPLRHLIDFANQHVWPTIRRIQPPPRLDRHCDRLAEYYRVFPSR